MVVYSSQTTLRAKTKEIVARYRREIGKCNRPLSFVRFAQQLGAFGQKISYQSIKNWEDGVHAPDVVFLIHLMDAAPPDSWQWRFAKDILAVYSER